MKHRARKAVWAAAAAVALCAAGAAAADWVSVSVRKANIRFAPAASARVAWRIWIYSPLRVVGRDGSWLRIVDYAGGRGWIRDRDVGSSPAVVVAARAANLRSSPAMGDNVEWVLEESYPLRVLETRGRWLRVTDDEDVDGWIHASAVWGFTAPDERRRDEDDGSRA